MDYGCAIYGAARPSRLRVLESIHCTGLRLALGAFRTSPLASLCCEAGIPPLKYRRNQFLSSYGSGIWAQPNHQNYSFMFEEEQDLYESRPSITRPIRVRLKELLDTMDVSLPNVHKFEVNEIPPWEITPISVNLDMLPYKKEETCRTLIISEFNKIISKYPNHQIIYTDGSRTENGIGSAFSHLGISYSWTLPCEAGNYTAELYAIWQALLYMETIPDNKYLICSDSLSAIQALKNPYNKDPIIQKCLARLMWLESQRKTTSFVWIPSHAGIHGNELADQAARLATEDNTQVSRHTLVTDHDALILTL